MKAFIIILGLLLGLNVQAQDFYLKVSSGIFKPAEMQSMQPNSKVAVQVAGPFRDANTVESSPPFWSYNKMDMFFKRLSYGAVLGWQKERFFVESGYSWLRSAVRAYSPYHGFGQTLAQASCTVSSHRIPLRLGYEYALSEGFSVYGIFGGNLIHYTMKKPKLVSRAWGFYEKNDQGQVEEFTVVNLFGSPPKSPSERSSGFLPECSLGLNLEIIEGLDIGLEGKWFFKTKMSLNGFSVLYKEFDKEQEKFDYINYGNGFQIDLSLRYSLPSNLFKLKKE